MLAIADCVCMLRQGAWMLEQKVKEAELASRSSPNSIHAIHARE